MNTDGGGIHRLFSSMSPLVTHQQDTSWIVARKQKSRPQSPNRDAEIDILDLLNARRALEEMM